MFVYIVMGSVDWEDSWIEKVFDSKEKAVEYIESFGYFIATKMENKWIFDREKYKKSSHEEVLVCDYLTIVKVEVL